MSNLILGGIILGIIILIPMAFISYFQFLSAVVNAIAI